MGKLHRARQLQFARAGLHREARRPPISRLHGEPGAPPPGVGGGGHGRRGGGGREELISEHGYDTKYAMHCARLGFQCIELLTTQQLELPIQGEAADWLRAVRRGDVPFQEWWRKVVDLDAGCCGMAGSFGYSKEHYEVSKQIGERKLLPAARAMTPGSVLVAPGTSCREQVKHFTGVSAVHPAQLLQSLLSRA